MKKVLLLSGLFIFLFSCDKEDKTKPKGQTANCRIIEAEVIEEGESRIEILQYDSTNRLTKKCLSYSESYQVCSDIIYSNNEIVYTFFDSTINQVDTIFKGIYKNKHLKKYIDYTYTESQYTLFKYSPTTNHLVELIDSAGNYKRVYDVKTNNEGNPTQLTLTHRTSSSVYDIVEMEITYSNYTNPEQFDLSTQAWISFFPSKIPIKVTYTSAESYITNMNYQIMSNGGKYPSDITLIIDEDVYKESKFSYKCD
jgi:hypothetical protein